MTEKLEIYKCEICGNIIQILQSGIGHPVCCGEEMKLEIPKHEENELGEKHNPEFIESDGKKFVNVISHPMTEEHYIQFIEVFSSDKNELHIKFFTPQNRPELEITHMQNLDNAIEYCNIHRLWRNK